MATERANNLSMTCFCPPHQWACMHEHEGIPQKVRLKVIRVFLTRDFVWIVLILKVYADWMVRCIMLVLGDKTQKSEIQKRTAVPLFGQ